MDEFTWNLFKYIFVLQVSLGQSNYPIRSILPPPSTWLLQTWWLSTQFLNIHDQPNISKRRHYNIGLSVLAHFRLPSLQYDHRDQTWDQTWQDLLKNIDHLTSLCMRPSQTLVILLLLLTLFKPPRVHLIESPWHCPPYYETLIWSTLSQSIKTYWQIICYIILIRWKGDNTNRITKTTLSAAMFKMKISFPYNFW